MTDQGDIPLMVLPASALAKQLQKSPKKHGHAALPGTGPEGETCKSCRHIARKEMASTYLKCQLMRAYWTGGYATDVRATDAACRRWEAAEPGDATR